MALTAAGGASVGPSTLVVVQLFNATETTADEGCAWQLMLYVDTLNTKTTWKDG